MNNASQVFSQVAILELLDFRMLSEWAADDHAAALSCFRVSARRMKEKPYTTKKLGIDALVLADAAKAALDIDINAKDIGIKARHFF